MADDDGRHEIDAHEITLSESVGSGVTAEVHRGVWDGKDVAVKVFTLQKGSLPKSMQTTFTREVAIMSRVKHENLVKLYGIVISPLQLVTEFCEGGSLYDLLHHEDPVELVWKQQLKMCLDVAYGVDYLHSCRPQVIHRDLKSLNLLLYRQVTSPKDVPLVKVSDFGLARMKEADQAEGWQTLTSAAGTAHWMAPEVPKGRYTEKADVYSYAMVLFEIICREVPFEDENAKDAMQMHMRGHRPDKEAIPPDVPVALERLMVGCWDQNPERRPPFTEILKILKAIRL